MTDTRPLNLLITCADGLENALLTELIGLGFDPADTQAGRIMLATDITGLYRICLYSRVASRVLLPLGECTLEGGDIAQRLYDFALGIDWVALFGVDNTFAIRLSVDKHQQLNQQFATLRVKDAIADTFNARYGKRPDVDNKAPEFRIAVHVGKKSAGFALDLAGGSLHRRGYRVATTDAPLKENLAAALLYEAGWHKGDFELLYDPMCGSGTFVIEALLMHLGYPAGLDKANQGGFGFYHWCRHDETLWQQTVLAAQDAFHQNLDAKKPTIIASDVSDSAIQACKANIHASALAPIADHICIHHAPLANLPTIAPKDKKTLVITNPPYGERLGDEGLIKPLYQGLGLLCQDLDNVYIGVLAAAVEMADVLPLDTPKTLRCHNGALTVYFRHGKLMPKTDTLIERFKKDDEQDPSAEFVNRLQKNLLRLKKQSKAAGVTNLRIYDADLPNFNVAIDLYGDRVHVQEYKAPKSIDPAVAKQRFNAVLASIRHVLGVGREHLFIKTRAKQQGNQQYSKQGQGKPFVVAEGGAYFYVNLSDYLDTGLFLDHRPIREQLAAQSLGKDVLNLFAYTCTASVHMALAGAKTVTSVDLSDNYLFWGKQNFVLNGMATDGAGYHFIASDAFEWIKECKDKFDVIFIDPPTFSNSKKFFGTFDVQRDHSALINRAMNRLNAGGVLYFSNNFSRFVLDETLTERYEVSHISAQTLGFDFKKGAHHSFCITHKGDPLPKSMPIARRANAQTADTYKIQPPAPTPKTPKTPKQAPTSRTIKGFGGRWVKPKDKPTPKDEETQTPKRFYINPKHRQD